VSVESLILLHSCITLLLNAMRQRLDYSKKKKKKKQKKKESSIPWP
jgi:hypothetical protein